MMLSFILTMLMRRCCQRALIRAMNAVLSYHNFWLPGLMRNFLFEVLEDVWAPVLRDSFKMILIFCWLYQLNYRGGSRGLKYNTMGENSPKDQYVQCNQRTSVRLSTNQRTSVRLSVCGSSLWLPVLVHGCFIKVRNVRGVYSYDTLDV